MAVFGKCLSMLSQFRETKQGPMLRTETGSKLRYWFYINKEIQTYIYCRRRWLIISFTDRNMPGRNFTWWRHQMETFSALLALCAGNSPVPVTSPHKGQWRGALMFSLICVWINCWINNREAGDLRRYGAHSDVIVMIKIYAFYSRNISEYVVCKIITVTSWWTR